MRKLFIIALTITCMFGFSACTETAETTSANNQIMASPKLAPLIFDVPDELEASTAAEIQASMTASILQIKKEALPVNNAYDLDKVDYYYIPVYVDQWCQLTRIFFNGGAIGNIVLDYNIPNSNRAYTLTLQFDRDAEYGEELFEDYISRTEMQPFELCEGIYYKDVYNPGDNGALSFTKFCWVHDGYSFMMQVWPEVMEQILENDPNALKGALFELEKVMLETPSDDNAEVE